MTEAETRVCDRCGDAYEAHLDEWAMGPDGHCDDCRAEERREGVRGAPTHVAVEGRRFRGFLDEDCRRLARLHGVHAAVAAQAFRIVPTAETATVEYSGRQRRFHRADFEDPAVDVCLDREPRHPRWRRRRRRVVSAAGDGDAQVRGTANGV